MVKLRPDEKRDTSDIDKLGLDRFGRVKESLWYDYASSADADRVKYGYDRQGNRTYREQTVDANSNYDEFYAYDAIDRLKQSDRGTLGAQKDSISSLNFAQCWELDSTGNWQGFKQDDNGNTTWDLAQTRTSNPVNEITDITESSGPSWLTPTYNRAGNMTTIPKPTDPTTGYTATYDAWNRLVTLTDGVNTVAEYRYDAAKRRIVKKAYTAGILDETRHSYYTEPSKWQVIEERVDTSTNPDRQFVWGQRYLDDLILRDRDTNNPKNGTLDERLYTLQDANWNATSIANTSGSIQERYAYDAYGTPRFLTPAFATRASSSYTWDVLFAAYRWDDESQFYQVRNRALVPGLGWLQRDPLGLSAGPNLYVYALSNSLNLTDPFGLAVIPVSIILACFLSSACAALAALLGVAVVLLLAAALTLLLMAFIDWLGTLCLIEIKVVGICSCYCKDPLHLDDGWIDFVGTIPIEDCLGNFLCTCGPGGPDLEGHPPWEVAL